MRRPAVAGTGLQLGDPALEEATLARRAREGERLVERFARLIAPAEAAQQFAARRVQVLVVVEVEAIDDRSA